MLKFFAFFLFLSGNGDLGAVQVKPEGFQTLDACKEFVSETLSANKKTPFPDGVVQIEGACLPVKVKYQTETVSNI